MYLGQALGDVTASDFVTSSGVCKPANFETLAKFKALQTQLNRVAQLKGASKIAVDGDIGPGTIRLLGSTINGQPTQCQSIAIIAEALTAQLKAIADRGGAPATVSSPKPAATPAIVNAATGVITPQPASSSMLDVVNRLSTTEKLIAAAALGGAAYLVLGKKKRRR